MVSFGALYDAANNLPDGNLKISDVVMYLIPIGDRLDRAGLIAPNDDFGGRSVLAGYFPSITKQELQVALSSIGNPRSENVLTVLTDPEEVQLPLGNLEEEPEQPSVLQMRLAFDNPY